MSGIITRGYGENQLIITRGYGQVAIIIPIVHGGVTERKQVKPRIIYVNEKYVLAMQKLSIFKPIFLELNTDSVSYFKEGISNAELNPLKIIDYREFFIELQKSNNFRFRLLNIIISYL